MSQQPRNSIDLPFIDPAGDSLITRSVPGLSFIAQDRPPVHGKDTRTQWRRFSDWIFDGIFPEQQTNFYGEGNTERMEALQERAALQRRGGKPFIDKDEGNDARLAADLLVGFADEGKIPVHSDPDAEIADELMLMQAGETIENPDASSDQKREAAAVVGERALRQLIDKQAAEADLASMSNGEDLTKRVMEMWADGKRSEEIGKELREGGWDYSMADLKMFERLEQETEILLDEGELGRAKALTFARLNLMRNGGAPDANITPYDELLDKYIEADAADMTASEAFSIAGTDTFLSTIRGIGRLTGLGYTTEKDRDILEKMTAHAFDKHPISSLAGSFTGGFLDPVFFGVSMSAAKAPITAIQRSRYVDTLVARGVGAKTAAELGKKATMETIASERLSKYFLNRGLSMRTSQAAGRLVWNITDAAVTNGAAEAVIAGGEGLSPTEIGIRALKGAGTGVAMGVVLDRAFAGIGKVSRVLGGTVPGEVSSKLDKAISYAAAAGGDGAKVSKDLRNLTKTWADLRTGLGRKLTAEEASLAAQNLGVDLDELVKLRAEQVQAIKDRRAGRAQQAKAGDTLSQLELEAIERGILKAPSAEPTPAERARQAAQGDAALEAKYGKDLHEHELDQEARDRGVIKDAEPEPKTPQERKKRSDAADAELESRFGPEVQAHERELEVLRRKTPDQLKALADGGDANAQRVVTERAQASRDFPERVNADDLSRIEAPSADLEDPTAQDLDMSAKFQRGNIDQIDHRDGDFVKVRVPIDELEFNRAGLEAEPEVDAYRNQNPEKRPPPAVGPAIDGGDKMIVADGQRRATAAKLNGETEIVAYVPEWYAKERGFDAARSKSGLGDNRRSGKGVARKTPAKDGGSIKTGKTPATTPEIPGPRVTAAARKDARLMLPEDLAGDEELVGMAQAALLKNDEYRRRHEALTAARARSRSMDMAERTAAEDEIARQGEAIDALIEEITDDFILSNTDEIDAARDRMTHDREVVGTIGPGPRGRAPTPESLPPATDRPAKAPKTPKTMEEGGVRDLTQEESDKISQRLDKIMAIGDPVRVGENIEYARRQLDFLAKAIRSRDTRHIVGFVNAAGNKLRPAYRYAWSAMTGTKIKAGESMAEAERLVNEWVSTHPIGQGLPDSQSRNADLPEFAINRSGQFGTGDQRPATGKPAIVEGFIGSGRADAASVYGDGADGPIFGPGKYMAASQSVARRFGPDVRAETIELRSPYVIENKADIENLAGGPIPLDNPSRRPYIDGFINEVRKRGHDGIIVQLPVNTDITPDGGSNKRLVEIFGDTQAFKFGETDAQTRRARPADAPDQPAAPAVRPPRDAKGEHIDGSPPPPAVEPAGGRQTSVRVPDRSEPLAARYTIVEADDLIPSHDARQGFVPNRYGDLNERPYNDPSEGKVLRARVGAMAESIDPDFVLSDTPTAVDGPPIVTPDLVVLGGNARAMAQQAAYSRGKGAVLDSATRAAAERFGIPTQDLGRFKNPVLVRVLDEGQAGAPGELSRDLNQSFTGSRTSDADAVSRSGKIDPGVARKIAAITQGRTLGDVFNTPKDSTRLQTVLVGSGAFTQADLDGMVDQRGLFTQAGRRQIENTLLGVAVPDVRRMAELSPSLRNTLVKALPALTTLRTTGIDGQDFVKTLANALDIVKELKATGARSIDDLIAQASMTPQPWRGDDQAVALARALDSENQTTIVAKLNALAKITDDEMSGQGRMFDDDDSASGFDALFGGRSKMSIDGPRRVNGTERSMPEGITGHDLDSIKGVPGDQMELTKHSASPQSGVDPGIKRQTPPAWVNKPATTRRGKKVVGRIKSDPRGNRYGVRSIAEGLTNDLDGLMVRQTREQSTARNPAHYAQQPHMVRTRSASEPNWMFHEQGHAISSIVRESKPDFLRTFEDELLEIAHWSGSMASKKTPEEGFAEFIRRMITDPTRMEAWAPTAKIMGALEAANPKITEAVRDAARGYDAHMQRPIDARWRSYMSDTKASPTGVKRVAARVMVDYVSRGFAPELAQREVMIQLRKDDNAMRKSYQTIAKLEAKIKDTAGDMNSAYQSLNHIGQITNIALEGPGKVKPGAPTGMRVHATVIPEQLKGTAFDRPRSKAEGQKSPPAMLSEGQREVLEAGGFKDLPAEPKKHGDMVVLAPKSVADAISPIPRKQWKDFETYAQIKATVARIKARALEGESFPYQTSGEGVGPMDLIKTLRKADAAHPEWAGVFDDLEQIANATLVLDVMSGEISAKDAVKLKNRFEHYLPLTRQGEGGPRAIRSGATTAPSANIRRSRGSVNPAEPILMAMARKIDEAVNAYYWNRSAMSPIIMSQMLQKMDDVPRSAKIAASRLGVPLHLDRVKLASASPEEVKRAIYKYIVEEVQSGSTLFNMSPDELPSFTIDDIGVVDGFDIWRHQKPKAVNVLAPNINGQRHYFQVLDENLYRIYANGGENTVEVARLAELAFGSMTQGLKNMLTQNIVFTGRNIVRDAGTAVMFGQGKEKYIPGIYHVVGALAMLTGKGPDTLVKPELLSRVFSRTSSEDFARQRSKLMQLLVENLVPRGWNDLSILQKSVSAPGIAVRVLMRPVELSLVLTGQRALATASETAPRLGAYIMAKRRGLSDEAAQLAADTVTGNFSERPLSGTAHSIYRNAGFVNPAMQIFGQTARFVTDPDPKRAAAVIGTVAGDIAMMTGAIWALNYLTTSDEDRARNAERTEDERVTHMDIHGLRIPFDYGIQGGVQSLTWNTLDRLSGQGGASGARIAHKIINEIFPHTSLNPISLAPMPMQAVIEAQIGYSFYRADNLEPPFMQYLEPPERYFDSTPDLYKWVGRMANASPIRAQYFVRNGLGVKVDDMVRLLDRIENGFTIDELSDLPELGRLFSRDPIGWNSRSVQDAAAISDKYNNAKRRAKRMAEDPGVDKEALAEIVAILNKLEPVHEAMLEIQRAYDASKDAARTDPKAARRLKEQMVEIARQGLMRMNEVEGQGGSDDGR